MFWKTRLARTMALVLPAAVLSGCVHAPEIPPVAGLVSSPAPVVSTTVPVIADDNRMFVDLDLVRPDGTIRKARAFVNMGAVGPVLNPALIHELGIMQGHDLEIRFGALPIHVAKASLQSESQSSGFRIALNPFGGGPAPISDTPPPGEDQMAVLSGPLNVEMELGSGVLQAFDVALDYGARTITLAAPGTLAHDGVALPFTRNPKTGFITVDMAVNGKTLRMVIDNGGSYSVLREEAVTALVKIHPDWVVSDTAIGEANITGQGLEAGSPVLRLPEADIGPLHLTEIGMASAGMGSRMVRMIGGWFWDYYSDKAGERIDGWIGGNVLKGYRITFDYTHGMSYWARASDLDPHDLDGVDITLARIPGHYLVAQIAQKNGAPVTDVLQPGDAIESIDGLALANATRGQIFAALHGAPGTVKQMAIVRGGKAMTVSVVASAF